MNTDLKTMSRKELEKLLEDVKKALQSARARDQRNARKAAEKAAAEFGFSLDEISEKPTTEKKSKKAKASGKSTPSKPKYANPADKSATWTGKGRQPNWYREAVESGTQPESMLI